MIPGNENQSDDNAYRLVMPYWIDVDTYTDRDRLMFVVGAEFEMTLDQLRRSSDSYETTIHRENESRIRMMCGRLGRRCSITSCNEQDDPDGSWSYLTVEAVEHPWPGDQ